MSNNQSSMYKKFILGAASAALVASAVAPVASAKDFSDTKGNTHEPAIDALSDAGVITGYPDGSFLPNKTLTRSDVVKLMGKWLVSKDYKVPADYKTNMRFTDLTSKSNDELLQYAAIVKDNGVFNGSNGRLLAGDNITRENMAVVIVRAFDKVNDMDLVTFVKAQEFKKDVIDLAKAKAEARPAIDVLDFFDITNPAAPAFNPKNTTTRGQFATFLHKTMNTDFSAVKAPNADKVAVDAALAQVKAGAVTVSRGEYATDKNKLAAVQAYVTSLVTEKDVVATVTEGKTAGDYVVTLTKGEAKAEKTIAITFDFAADDKFVTEVQAVNAKQVLVKFSKEVGTGAEETKNYTVKEVASTTANAVMDAEVQADGKSVLLTLTNAHRVSTDVQVSVTGIFVKGSIKDTFDKFSAVVTVNDTVAPEIASVTASTGTNAAQVATVKFSEPIKGTPVFKVNGKVVTSVVVNKTATDFTISGLNLAADKVHTLEVIGLEDFADHKVALATKTFEVTKDTTEAKGNAKVVQDNKVQITFDKAVNKASLTNVDILRYDSTAKSYVPVKLTSTESVTLDKTGKVATFHIDSTEKANFFGTNDSTEELTVKVKTGVLDSVGNQVTKFEEKVVATQDVTGPALQEVTSDKNSKGEATKLYFHFDETLDAVQATVTNTHVVVTDLSTNAVVPFNDVFGTNTAVLATDKQTVVVTLDTAAKNKLKTGNYSFEVQSGFVKDDSFAENSNKKAAKAVDFGTVAKEVTVDNVVINKGTAVDNKAVVTFSKAVTASSAKNPANYTINGTALPATTVIVVTDRTATFTLPEGTVATSDASAILTVNNVQAQDSSATFKNYVGAINALDNTRPVATATVLKNGMIQLTFSEAVDVKEDDFANVKLNGLTLNTTATNKTVQTVASIKLVDGTQAVTITVVPKVAANFNDTGLTYQYIDVDGDNKFDQDKDIELQKVQATTAPATWSTKISDLNLLTSVEVLTAATTVTKDESTYKGTGNLLKANDVIKVK